MYLGSFSKYSLCNLWINYTNHVIYKGFLCHLCTQACLIYMSMTIIPQNIYLQKYHFFRIYKEGTLRTFWWSCIVPDLSFVVYSSCPQIFKPKLGNIKKIMKTKKIFQGLEVGPGSKQKNTKKTSFFLIKINKLPPTNSFRSFFRYTF